MAEQWHDIDDPGIWVKPKAAQPDATAAQAQSQPPLEGKKEAYVRLSKGEFLPPTEGIDFNQKCKVRVKVDYLNDLGKPMKKVTFSLFSIYKDETKSLSQTVDGYEKDGYAEAEMTMYYPPGHKGDDSARLFFKAFHLRGEKKIESEKITLPQKEAKVPKETDDVLIFESTTFKYRKTNKSIDECIKTLAKELRSGFKSNIENTIKEMHKQGFAFGVLDSAKAGYRTFQMQSEIDSDKTKAGPGESYHNYGLAVDLGVIEWVDEDGKSYSDFWLGKMDGITKYKGFSSKIWKKRNECAGSDIYTLSWEIIHLQGVSAETSGRSALVKAMNKAAEDSGDNAWKYRKATGGTYDSTLGSEKEWKNIGTSKQMWGKTAMACTDEQRETIRKHMEKAEKIALTIEP